MVLQGGLCYHELKQMFRERMSKKGVVRWRSGMWRLI